MALEGSTIIRFAPGATVFARGPGSLQFGADATRSGIVETPAAGPLAGVLRTLRSPTRLEWLVETARAECGLEPEEILSLVADLLSYRVLVTTPPSAALLVGRTPLGDALLSLLASARMQVRTPLRRESHERFLANSDRSLPLLVVDQLVSATHLAHLTRQRSGPIVPVSLVDARVFVGPVGMDRSGPCLHCAHLYHVDRDANWARVARAIRDNPPEPDPLVIAAGAAAAARVVRRICGAPDPPGVSAKHPARGLRLIVDPFGPEPEVQEELPPHPSCPVCY